jgi:hypothetical protein
MARILHPDMVLILGDGHKRSTAGSGVLCTFKPVGNLVRQGIIHTNA